MATIVLVHGAWGGSYGFRTVRNMLQARGHEVISPSLTGIGERAHLAGAHVDLNLHIDDVYNAIFYEDLTDIVLLGFSYGGMVVTGALDRLGDRVRSLVYLDALVPSDGQCAHDLVPLPLPEDTWEVPPLPRELATPEATAWSNARRMPMSIGTFTTPISLATPLEERGLPLAFIKATADPNESPESAFWQAARHAEASPAWTYHEVATNHMVPSMEPEALTDILDALAS
jgi:pimeloyl-ACP methyl ester carboxylesterase